MVGTMFPSSGETSGSTINGVKKTIVVGTFSLLEFLVDNGDHIL